MIKFAAISPHAPILLPNTGSPADHLKLKKTLTALKELATEFEKARVDEIIISSPHEDWGFDVPLSLIAPNFKGKIQYFLTGFESPKQHFENGKKFAKKLDNSKRYALIASGDLSHCLKKDGPYGFHPDGPKFDKELIQIFRTENLYNIFNLEDKYPEAGNCGLRSFAFALGILTGANQKPKPQILSYEGPFGVGYLVAKLLGD